MYRLVFLITTLLFLTISSVGQIAASYQSGAGTKVMANIPSKVDIRIFGYTAPYAIVQATSIRVFAQVSSDKTGYFVIDPLPISQEAREICLTTIDSERRSGFPLCISLPEIDKPTEIGPLLLSPTISLSTNNLVQLQNKTAAASGETLPNAEVEISFFDNESKGTKLTDFLFPKAYAKSVPKLTTKTDQKGNFSINLPSGKVMAYRLFAKAYYDPPGGEAGGVTPKSQTLIFTVSSYTTWWLINILPKLLLLLLLLVLLFILALYERKTHKARKFWKKFSERKLKPFGVRSRLALRRISYNLKEIWRSHQI